MIKIRFVIYLLLFHQLMMAQSHALKIIPNMGTGKFFLRYKGQSLDSVAFNSMQFAGVDVRLQTSKHLFLFSGFEWGKDFTTIDFGDEIIKKHINHIRIPIQIGYYFYQPKNIRLFTKFGATQSFFTTTNGSEKYRSVLQDYYASLHCGVGMELYRHILITAGYEHGICDYLHFDKQAITARKKTFVLSFGLML